VHIYAHFYEHARHSLTINRNGPKALEDRNGKTARHIRNGETAQHIKPNTKIDQKQAHRETLRSTNTIVEQTQSSPRQTTVYCGIVKYFRNLRSFGRPKIITF
jgi:hypothetical protein